MQNMFKQAPEYGTRILWTHVQTGSFEDLHNQNVFGEINVQNRTETDS